MIKRGRKSIGTLLDKITGLKKCNCCEQYKPGSEFYKDNSTKDGLERKCKECRKQYDKNKKDKNKKDKKNNKKDNPTATLLDPVTGLKKCNHCKQYKPASEFPKDKNKKDGLDPWCRQCHKQYYEEHKEQRLQYVNQYYEEHKEERLQYYEENKEKIQQSNKHIYEGTKNGTHKVNPRKTREQFIQELNRKNPDIEVLEDYQGVQVKIKCRCKLDGYEWEATPNSLLSGQGCPKCNITKGEKRVAQYLDNLGIHYIYNKCYFKDLLAVKGGVMRPDFIISSLKIWIEYDGEQHYYPIDFTGKMSEEEVQEQFKQTQQNDNIKNQYAKDNNWTLIRIPYWDYDNIEQILDSYLK